MKTGNIDRDPILPYSFCSLPGIFDNPLLAPSSTGRERLYLPEENCWVNTNVVFYLPTFVSVWRLKQSQDKHKPEGLC